MPNPDPTPPTPPVKEKKKVKKQREILIEARADGRVRTEIIEELVDEE